VRAVGVTVGLLCARRLATRLRYRAPPEEEPNDRP
jgi:cytochrome b561